MVQTCVETITEKFMLPVKITSKIKILGSSTIYRYVITTVVTPFLPFLMCIHLVVRRGLNANMLTVELMIGIQSLPAGCPMFKRTKPRATLSAC